MRKKYFLSACLSLYLLFLGGVISLYSQPDEIFYSNFSSGLGARAMGMGSAYIALSNDSTAASWNPAGLASLSRSEISVSFSYNNLQRQIPDYEYSSILLGYPIHYRVSRTDDKSIGKYFDFFGFVLPFRLKSLKFVTQVSYQRKIPFSLTSERAYTFEYQSRYQHNYNYTFHSEGTSGLDIISLSAATELFQIFQVGISINKWLNGFTLPNQEFYSYSIDNFYGWTGEWEDQIKDTLKLTISGYSFDFGVIFKTSDKINLGFVFKTGLNGNIDYSNTAEYWNGYTDEQQSGSYSGTGKIIIPSTIGGGISFSLNKDLIIAVDYKKTFWSKGRIKNYARANSSGGVPLPGDVLYPTMKLPGYSEQMDTQQFCIGLEHIEKIRNISFPIRAGISYNYQCSLDSKNRQKKYLGISLGSGISLKHLCLDVALAQYIGKYNYARDFREMYPQSVKEVSANLFMLRSSLSYKF